MSGLATAFAALVAAWALVEALCAAGLWWLRRESGVHYAPRDRLVLSRTCRSFIERLLAERGKGETLELSASLGWTTRPQAVSRDGRIHLDAHGLRGTTDPTRAPAPGRVRIAAFGDCLTLGGGVSDEQSWPAQLEQLAPGLEVLNFGVDGYGPDQMLLRYLESADLCAGCSTVVLALVSTNLYKTRNAFRPFYAYDHGLQLAKPRFVLRAGELERIPNPLPTLADYRALLEDAESQLARLARHDDYRREAYRSGPLDWLPSARLAKSVSGALRVQRAVRARNGDYVAGSPALCLTKAIVDSFCGRARERGAQPLIVFLPLAADLRRRQRAGVKTYELLIRHCAELKHPFVDALDAFGPQPARELFDGIHYTPLANRLVASAVLAATPSRSAR